MKEASRNLILFALSIASALGLVFLISTLIRSENKGEIVRDSNNSQVLKGLDLDQDGKEDLLTFEAGFNPPYWRLYDLNSLDSPRMVLAKNEGSFSTWRFGDLDSVPVPGDYNGDGKLDLASFRPRYQTAWSAPGQDDSKGNWQVYFASANNQASKFSAENFKSFIWGIQEAKAVPADYDGDRVTDFAVFDPTHGAWHIALSAKGRNFQKAHMGKEGFGLHFKLGGWGDIPVVGDYNGDGKADLALFQPDKAVWKIAYSSQAGNNLKTRIIFFGREGDIPVPADYDCDGTTNIAVYRPSQKRWFILYSKEKREEIDWGVRGAEPLNADFDGDSCPELAFYNPAGPAFFEIMSSGFRKEVRKRYITKITWGSKDWPPVQVAQRRYYYDY